MNSKIMDFKFFNFNFVLAVTFIIFCSYFGEIEGSLARKVRRDDGAVEEGTEGLQLPVQELDEEISKESIDATMASLTDDDSLRQDSNNTVDEHDNEKTLKKGNGKDRVQPENSDNEKTLKKGNGKDRVQPENSDNEKTLKKGNGKDKVQPENDDNEKTLKNENGKDRVQTESGDNEKTLQKGNGKDRVQPENDDNEKTLKNENGKDRVQTESGANEKTIKNENDKDRVQAENGNGDGKSVNPKNANGNGKEIVHPVNGNGNRKDLSDVKNGNTIAKNGNGDGEKLVSEIDTKNGNGNFKESSRIHSESVKNEESKNEGDDKMVVDDAEKDSPRMPVIQEDSRKIQGAKQPAKSAQKLKSDNAARRIVQEPTTVSEDISTPEPAELEDGNGEPEVQETPSGAASRNEITSIVSRIFIFVSVIFSLKN